MLDNQMKSSVIVESVHAQFLRKFLQCKGYWDETRKLKRIENGKVAIPVILENETEIEKLELIITESLNSKQLAEIPEFQIDNVLLPPSKKSQIQTPHDKLLKVLANFLRVYQIDFTEDLKMDVPSHWEVHGDLVLFPEKCFKCQIWKNLESSLWRDIAAVFDCNKVAQKSVVSRDGFRTPQVTLLHGEDGWIHQVDNGLSFTYDVTKCMYSSGNITEKLRIAKFNCEEETVVDLYAGIGYFTIPYLVHAKAKHVHACEWNPDAVEALNKNLQLNNVSDRCTVHYGDNRKVCPTGVADRVNLGLIPSSEPGWSVACAALNPVTGGILHIHHNVTSSQKCLNTSNSENLQSETSNNLCDNLKRSRSCEDGSNIMVESVVQDGNRKCLNYEEVCTCVNGELRLSLQISGQSAAVSELGQGCVSGQESGQGSVSGQEVDQSALVLKSCQDGVSDHELGQSATVSELGQGGVSGQELGQGSMSGQELGHLAAVSETGQGDVSCQEVDQSALVLKSCQDGVSDHELGQSATVSESGQGDVSCQEVDQSALVSKSCQDGVSDHELGQSATVSESGQGGVSVQELGQGDDLVKEWGHGVEQTKKCQSLQIANNKGKLDKIMDGTITSLNIGENNICTKCGKIRLKTFDSGVSQLKRYVWSQWACSVSDSIINLLHQLHKKKWTTNILHIEHVKSYAPHIDHLVLDLECRPDR